MRGLLPDDVFRLKQVTAVALSPDGERLAYVVREPDRSRDTYASNIWVVELETLTATQLTSGAYQDSSPRWSPDGLLLAFLSDRGTPNAQNLFVVDLGRPDSVRQLTFFEDDVVVSLVYPVTESIAWAPDGETICIGARDPADGSRDPRVSVFDTKRYKSAEYGWLDGRRSHLWLIPVHGGTPRQLTDGDWDDGEPAFSPDGSSIAFISNRSNADAAGPGSTGAVWIVSPVAPDLEARQVTGGGGPTWAPSFSPDGTRIAYFGHRDLSAGYAKNIHLWITVVDQADSDSDVLAEWDATAAPIVMSDLHHVFAPSSAVWAPDGLTLFFVGTVRGSTNVYQVDLRDGLVQQTTSGAHEVIAVTFDAHRWKFAVIVSDERSPADVFLGVVGDTLLRRISDVNREVLVDIYRSRARTFTYSAPSGLDVEAFVLAPPDERRARNPLVLEILPGAHFVHGYSFNFEYQMLAGAGYIVLHPNPPGAGSYGEAFSAAAAGTIFSDGHLDLIAACDVVVASGDADDARLGITGDAAGGGMTNWTIGHSDRFRAAVARRSISDQISMFGTSDRGASASTMILHDFGFADPYTRPDLYLQESPLAYVRNVVTPLLLIHSEGDMREPLGQAEEMYVALKHLGKKARLMVFHNDTHFLTRMGGPIDRSLFFAAIKEWFDVELGKSDDGPEEPTGANDASATGRSRA